MSFQRQYERTVAAEAAAAAEADKLMEERRAADPGPTSSFNFYAPKNSMEDLYRKEELDARLEKEYAEKEAEKARKKANDARYDPSISESDRAELEEKARQAGNIGKKDECCVM